jgi:hypothetical protein
VTDHAAPTWDRQPSLYWQHREPLSCPEKHMMGWLGSVYWFCAECRVIFVQGAN